MRVSRREFLEGSARIVVGGAAAASGLATALAEVKIEGIEKPVPVFDGHVHFGGSYGSPERLLETLKANSVDGAVLVQRGGSVNNAYIVDLVKKHPKVFIGVAKLDYKAEDAPARLEELVKAGGIGGIRIGERDRSPGDDPYAIWKKCAELGIVANIRGRFSYLGGPEFAELIKAAPNLKIRIEHLGRPNAGEKPPYPEYSKMLKLADFPNVYVKASGLSSFAGSGVPYPYKNMWPFVEMVVKAFGADRVMWASDYPIIFKDPGYAKILRIYTHELPFLKPDQRAMILGGTAMKLWPTLKAE